MQHSKLPKLFILLIAFLFIGASTAFALTCTLTLDDGDNDQAAIAGYHVYSSDTPGDYSETPVSIYPDASDPTLVPAGTTTVNLELLEGQNYVIVKVVGTNGRESAASSELDGTRPNPLKGLTGLWGD